MSYSEQNFVPREVSEHFFNRREVKDAHKFLRDIFHEACRGLSKEEKAEMRKDLQNLLRFLPPEPKPTMAEVMWSSKEHYLAEATVRDHDDDSIEGHPPIDKVVMLKEADDDTITVINISVPILGVSDYDKDILVPTGRYYRLFLDGEH